MTTLSSPVHTDLWRCLKTLHYAYQASNWQCHFVKKPASAFKLNTSNMTFHFFWSLHRDNNGTHTRTIFKSLHFEAPKMVLSCKWMHKKIQFLVEKPPNNSNGTEKRYCWNHFQNYFISIWWIIKTMNDKKQSPFCFKKKHLKLQTTKLQCT